jgi:hypothetical protein
MLEHDGRVSMIDASDITGLINVDGMPPTAKRIADLRRSYSRAKPFEPGSVSHGIAAYTPPLLGLDLAAALVAAGVEACIPDPVGDLLADRPLAMERDWGNGVVGRYVEAVRSMKRPLIGAEVDVLSKYRAVETLVPTAITAFKAAFFS